MAFSSAYRLKRPAYERAWRKKNAERVRKSHRAWMRRWYSEHPGEQYRRYGKRYGNCVAARASARRWWARQKALCSNAWLAKNLRTRIYLALKGKRKLNRTQKLIGCSLPELRQRLESQFQRGMSWKNYGQWHVDHKNPCAIFDLSTAAGQEACFHFSNLQPMWASENIRKGARVLIS